MIARSRAPTICACSLLRPSSRSIVATRARRGRRCIRSLPMFEVHLLARAASCSPLRREVDRDRELVGASPSRAVCEQMLDLPEPASGSPATRLAQVAQALSAPRCVHARRASDIPRCRSAGYPRWPVSASCAISESGDDRPLERTSSVRETPSANLLVRHDEDDGRQPRREAATGESRPQEALAAGSERRGACCAAGRRSRTSGRARRRHLEAFLPHACARPEAGRPAYRRGSVDFPRPTRSPSRPHAPVGVHLDVIDEGAQRRRHQSGGRG